MDLKRLFTDDDAVSPVIGVILMVAITVILAAVIAGFVTNFSLSGSAPQAQFNTEKVDDTTVKFNHDGGESANANQLWIVLDRGSGSSTLDGTGSDNQDMKVTNLNPGSSTTTLDIGESITVNDGGGSEDFTDDKLRLVWRNQDETRSTELTSWSGQDY